MPVMPLAVSFFFDSNSIVEDVFDLGRNVKADPSVGATCIGLAFDSYIYATNNLRIGTAFGSHIYVSNEYSYVVPLQIETAKIEPLPHELNTVESEIVKAAYDIPGRSMKLKVKMINTGNMPIAVGEYIWAKVRFLNKRLSHASANSHPQELIAPSGLYISNSSWLQPGKQRTLDIHAIDALWERERLVSFLTNFDSKLGGLLFFYNPDGERKIEEVNRTIFPMFKNI